MHAKAAGETKVKESSSCDLMVLLTTCVRGGLVDILAHGRISLRMKYVIEYSLTEMGIEWS